MGPLFTALKSLADWTVGRSAAEPILKQASQRMYAGANVDRLTSDWVTMGTSADSEILTSLRNLRARSRQLVRDNDYAKNAVRVIVNNVIGCGIGMQGHVVSSRGRMLEAINTEIEQGWEEWADKQFCDVAGLLHFHDMERQLISSLIESGEVLIRKHRRPFGGGKVPYALEVIEADQLMDQWQTARAENGNAIRMGVEIDEFHRPIAYWLHPVHPGDYQFTTFVPSAFERVPAEDIIHLYIADRPKQTRGVPWFHTALRRLNNMGGYEEAEIVAARSAACIMGFITSPEAPTPDEIVDNRRLMSMEPGAIETLLPGEDFTLANPARPNAHMDPFLRLMLRGVAAGIGVSYESLSRDYSQSNYSSSRLALLDDRDLWRSLQQWFIRNFRAAVHRDWLDAAVMSGEVRIQDYYANRRRYRQVRFRPRGWSWIDPTKEVQAYKMAVRAGFMTVSDVISKTGDGADLEEVMKSRRRELDFMAGLGIVTDTDPGILDSKGGAVSPEPPDDANPSESSPKEPTDE